MRLESIFDASQVHLVQGKRFSDDVLDDQSPFVDVLEALGGRDHLQTMHIKGYEGDGRRIRRGIGDASRQR